MKKELIILILLILNFTFISAEANCDLTVSLINQDPYPAIPGDYVKVIFQVYGVSEKSCGEVGIELIEKYPLVFDPGMDSIVKINSGVYAKDFGEFLIAPYKIRVDNDALNGANPI